MASSQVNWMAREPAGPLRVTAQIRHRHVPAAATVRSIEPGRGTRGGRSRKKPAAAAAASADDGVDVPADESNGRPAPRIHVPPSDLVATVVVPEPATDASTEAAEPEAGPAADGAVGADELPKRKRSRRGSRGGKKRRKPAAEGTDDVSPADEAGAEARGDDVEPPEYVPMSEWIDDFDSRSRV